MSQPRKRKFVICENCDTEWLKRADHIKYLKQKGRPILCASCAGKLKPKKPSIVKKLNEIDASYIAGFLEADGCITWSGKQPQISITNTQKEVLEWFRKIIGAGRISQVWARNPKHNHQFRWILHGTNNCIDFLGQILSLMKMNYKIKKAKEMLCQCSGVPIITNGE